MTRDQEGAEYDERLLEPMIISGHDVKQGVCVTLEIWPERGEVLSVCSGVPVRFYPGVA
jgi:hypothetical protein